MPLLPTTVASYDIPFCFIMVIIGAFHPLVDYRILTNHSANMFDNIQIVLEGFRI
jgi:hypothetical protein